MLRLSIVLEEKTNVCFSATIMVSFFLLFFTFQLPLQFPPKHQSPVLGHAVFGGKSFVPHVHDSNFASVSFDLTGHLINKTKQI